MTTTDLLIKLRRNNVVIAVPELKSLVVQLERSFMADCKLCGKYSEVISLMSDGVEYGDALEQCGL